jgi:hypothetical protein
VIIMGIFALLSRLESRAMAWREET